MRASLKGKQLAPIDEVFAIKRSLPHGHVEVILKMMQKLGMASVVSSRPGRERDLVLGMLVQRLIHPCSKLATTREWKETTLAEELGIEDAKVDELYKALAWLLKRKKRIEKRLFRRHVKAGDRVLYDVTSSYYEGRTCTLMVHGHSRDGRKDRPQVVYGVLTTLEGCPVGVEVYAGNTADPKTVPGWVEKIRTQYNLERVVMVGDRGMLTEARVEALRKYPGIGWITALRSTAIKRLLREGALHADLFDHRNLAEITSPLYPGERLVVCYNPTLAEERKKKREELLASTENRLARIEREVKRRTTTPLGKDVIGMKVGKAIARHKMEKHFTLHIEEGCFTWRRNEESIRQEEVLDGIYIIRTSEPEKRLDTEEVVRSYKHLAEIERVFRTLKGLDLLVRPIFHRLEDAVRAHIFLCVLAYYVEWHLRKALAPLLFDDEERDLTWKTRDPVAPAKSSASARRKKNRRATSEGLPLHSFQTLLHALATRCKNWCRFTKQKSAAPVVLFTTPTPLQERALELIKMYPVP